MDINTLTPSEKVMWAAGIPQDKWLGILDAATGGVMPFEMIVRLVQLDQFRETLRAVDQMKSTEFKREVS